jgi:hypothetical protein
MANAERTYFGLEISFCISSAEVIGFFDLENKGCFILHYIDMCVCVCVCVQNHITLLLMFYRFTHIFYTLVPSINNSLVNKMYQQQIKFFKTLIFTN